MTLIRLFLFHRRGGKSYLQALRRALEAGRRDRQFRKTAP